jgi:hypothetical protein
MKRRSSIDARDWYDRAAGRMQALEGIPRRRRRRLPWGVGNASESLRRMFGNGDGGGFNPPASQIGSEADEGSESGGGGDPIDTDTNAAGQPVTPHSGSPFIVPEGDKIEITSVGGSQGFRPGKLLSPVTSSASASATIANLALNGYLGECARCAAKRRARRVKR